MAESSGSADARRRAEESIAERFSRIMNATTSPYGVISDPPVVAIVTGPLLIALLAALRMGADPPVVWAIGALAALPIALALGVTVALLGARTGVVDWLAGVPFPVENLNAILNGIGEGIEITFAESCPTTNELNLELDKVSPASFVTRAPDIEAAPSPADESGKGKPAARQDRVMEIKLGVVDSPRNPAASNHKRYERVRALVGVVLVPLHARHKVVEVRIK